MELKTLLIIILVVAAAIGARFFFSLNEIDAENQGSAVITGYAVLDTSNESSSNVSDNENNLPDVARFPNPLRYLSSG
ncbi:MAG TPA: hypothetical protein VJI75_03300 [Candidatus Nanoarchaeia archaeon]|nr:hypothetical protein [Candidatus Nanoarchaeia archaeon]